MTRIREEEDSSKVIERSKVWRSRETTRNLQQFESDASLPGLYFDGRKDNTLVNVKADTRKYHRNEITEEHIVIVREPGSTYYCHVTPDGSSSKSIIKAMTTALVGKTDLKELTVVGCEYRPNRWRDTPAGTQSETPLAMAGVLTPCKRAATSTSVSVS